MSNDVKLILRDGRLYCPRCTEEVVRYEIRQVVYRQYVTLGTMGFDVSDEQAVGNDAYVRSWLVCNACDQTFDDAVLVGNTAEHTDD